MRPLPLALRINSHPQLPSRIDIRIHHGHGHHPSLSSCHSRSMSASRRRPPPPPLPSPSPTTKRYINGNYYHHHHHPSSNNPQSKSTGISYLDTWMGNTNSERRLAPATAAAAAATPPTPLPTTAPTTTHNNTPSAASTQFHQLPSSSTTYQMFPLIPTKTDTPESLLRRLNQQIHEEAAFSDRTSNSNSISNNLTMIPLVLDLSAFHHPNGSPHYSSATKGKLTQFVNAIRSYQGQGGGAGKTLNNNIGYYLVGATNLPRDDDDPSPMTEEARLLNLPIFYNSNSNNKNQSLNGPPSSAMPTFVNNSTSNNNDGSISITKPKRKKRGGVAPLLRQRRPGVAAFTTPKFTMDDMTMSSSSSAEETTASITTLHTTTTTSNNGSTSKRSNNTTTENDNIQIVGMGNLPPYNNHQAGTTTTKVHKGSIRSGQLLSSDQPNQSLVIIGSVNPGGEVWSEGDVYVFGKLRGRVLAGLSNVGGDGGGGGGGNNADSEGGSGSGVTARDWQADYGTNENADFENNNNNTNNSSMRDNDQSEEQQQLLSSPNEKKSNNSNNNNNNKPKSSTSKIFATSFDPELICIGDTFTTIDNVVQSCGLLDGVGPAMVTLDETTGELLFEKMEL